MARKRRRNAKVSKANSSSGNSRTALVLYAASTEKVAVPDFDIRVRRKSRGFADAFVDQTCIQERASMVKVFKGTEVKEVVRFLKKRKRRNSNSLAPFVPKECLVQTTTPVIRFSLALPFENESANTVQKKIKNKKKKTGFGCIAFAPKDCSSAEVSLGYKGHRIKETTPCIGYYPAFGTIKKKKKINHSKEFVPLSCITENISLSYIKLKVGGKSQQFCNPYSGWPGFAPQITTHKTIVRKKPSVSNQWFIPLSCITDQVSLPFQQPLKDTSSNALPKYTYVDRPNSPDIVDNRPKRGKKTRSNVVPFVPKSCTTNEYPPVAKSIEAQSWEALALESPKPEPLKTAGTNWYCWQLL
ncbi:hypothetical protein N752_01835 [Desulforamulus aquiferis]|nr:hypothetical protein [Desulforamulus aquiferis]RYD06893.1 hypothetical protein N752_01835 [Desulforamulus aquiferis]